MSCHLSLFAVCLPFEDFVPLSDLLGCGGPVVFIYVTFECFASMYLAFECSVNM